MRSSERRRLRRGVVGLRSPKRLAGSGDPAATNCRGHAHDGRNPIAWQTRDRAGAPIPGLEVRARFVHPFDRQADREAILASDGGAYEGVAGPLHSGRWTLVIEAKADGREKFTSRNKITLAETASGD